MWVKNKDVTIYGQSMFENLKNTDMGESNTLQLINFSPLRLNKGVHYIKFYLLEYLRSPLWMLKVSFH